MAEQDAKPEAVDQPEKAADQLPVLEEGSVVSDHIVGQEIKEPQKDKQAEPEAKDGAEPTPEDSQTPKDQPVEKDGAEPEGFDQAVQVLKRAKFSPSLIEKLSPQEVLDQAEQLRPIQANTDSMSRAYDSLRRDYEGLQKQVNTDQQKDVQPDLSLFASELSQIKSESGDEQAKAIESILSKQSAKYENEIQQLSQHVKQIEASRIQRDLAVAREGLLNDFPRLKSKETYDRVLERAKSLYSVTDANDRYGADVNAVMRDAAVLELGAPASDLAKSQLVDDHSNRKLSQPSSGSSPVGAEDVNLAGEDLEFAIFQAKEAGDDDRVARLRKQAGLT